MNRVRNRVALLALSVTACSSTPQSPASSGNSGNGTASGVSGTTTSGASGTSGSATSGLSGTSGSATSGLSGTSGSATSGLSGATSGTGGATGSSGTPSDGGIGPQDASLGGDGSVAQACSGMPLCDGFETDTVGGAPNAALWSIVTGCGGNDPMSTVMVDNTQAHTGENSVKVVGGTNTCGPMFYNSSVIGSLGSSVYGRFFVRFSVPLPMAHSGFMALGFQPDGGETTNYNFDNIEMTTQYGVFVWNYMDKTLPDMAPGASAPANTWMCFEFHTTGSGDLDTWLSEDGGAQGDPVPSMTFDPDASTVQNGVNDSWASSASIRPSPFKFTNISFGWVTFGGGPATVWFDDIALSSQRIGCR